MQNFPGRKKWFLGLSLFSNLGVLVAFKYSAFFWNSAVLLFNSNASLMQQWIIPAGLSFYIFQSLSYTTDVYRGKYQPKDSLSDFMLFVSFFPHMVAGPIVRYQNLMPQLKVLTYFKSINWSDFAKLVIWGYFKKLVIADNLSLVINPVFKNVSGFSGAELILAGFLFVVQLYCDFSGYSDIATGVAKLFNVQLSLNWQRPLLSKSLREFWQRYHIATTTWFRDYLYVALGGNRVGQVKGLINILLVFLISGLWHGANFTFIVWGGIHGIVYVLERLLHKKFPAYKAPAFLSHIYLLLFLSLSFLAFRANSITDLFYIYKTIFSVMPGYFELNNLLTLQFKLMYVVLTLAMITLLFKELNEEFAIINRFPKTYHYTKSAFYLTIVIIIFLAGNFSANTFIYFQF